MPGPRLVPWLVVAGCALRTGGSQCPGTVTLGGYGQVSLVNARWRAPGQPAGEVEVVDTGLGTDTHLIVPHMTGRTYFADTCSRGAYTNAQYVNLHLLGKTLRYTTDISGAECGCNGALSLVPMARNANATACGDHFCDASTLCGASCAEIDVQEANKYAWHSTLHLFDDRNGFGGGYAGWIPGKTWKVGDYGPKGRCIDTTMPFQVGISFPIDDGGSLEAVEVTLSQDEHPCPLELRLDEYTYGGRNGIDEMSTLLENGVTPVISYWGSTNMQWLDDPRSIGSIYCLIDDNTSCSESIQFYDFALEGIETPVSALKLDQQGIPALALPVDATAAEHHNLSHHVSHTATKCSANWTDCRQSRCCEDAESVCYERNHMWASCLRSCMPNAIWSCKELSLSAPEEKIDTNLILVRDELMPSQFAEGLGTASSGARRGGAAARSGAEERGPAQEEEGSAEAAEGSPAKSADAQPAKDDGPSRSQPAACTTATGNCLESRCCQDPKMRCFLKHDGWAGCRYDCEPGVHPSDPPRWRTNWTCAVLERRAPGDGGAGPAGRPLQDGHRKERLAKKQPAHACSAVGEDCRESRCCQDPAKRCYEKHRWFAGCLSTCVAGRNSSDDPLSVRSTWTCRTEWTSLEDFADEALTFATELQAQSDTAQHEAATRCVGVEDNCMVSRCCLDKKQRCYEKHEQWAGCRTSCTPGIHALDPLPWRTNWTCSVLSASETTPTSASRNSPTSEQVMDFTAVVEEDEQRRQLPVRTGRLGPGLPVLAAATTAVGASLLLAAAGPKIRRLSQARTYAELRGARLVNPAHAPAESREAAETSSFV